jgi:peptidyl-tRNA hydrolase
MAEFVLSPFEREERETVKVMIAEAADAVVAFATTGIARTMNKFNTRL